MFIEATTIDASFNGRIAPENSSNRGQNLKNSKSNQTPSFYIMRVTPWLQFKQLLV